MSGFSSLPEEALKLVMKHVPLRHRLSSCCLVGTMMHAAAVADTDDLELSHLSQQRAASLLGWMSHHGHNLTKFELKYYYEQPLQQLPCPNLLELKLDGCDVQLGPAFGYPGVVQGCTNLTRLVLECSIIDAPVHGAVLDGSLSRLVHLQYLLVVPFARPTLASLGGIQQYTLDGLSYVTLPRLQQLTFLKVHSLNVGNVQQLGALTNLHSLDLMVADDFTIIGPTCVPGMTFPASLKTLFLLSRAEPEVLSLVPTGLQELQASCTVGGPAEGPGSFLYGMARLQHLTSVILLGHGTVWPPAGPAYSALTASSKLQLLHVTDSYFPTGIWSHVFSAARKLPHLTSLILRGLEKYGGSYVGNVRTPPLWDAADISSFVSCCPSLCDIKRLPLQPGLHVSELHKLTALTALDVQCNSASWWPVVESLRGLAAVTSLHSLTVTTDCAEMTGAHLLPLTSLTALSSLSCKFQSDSRRFFSTQDSPPGVWLQLLMRCAAEPSCPTALRILAEQLTEQMSLTAQQQQQIADLREQLSAQQQSTAEQLTCLQQQLSAQQQVAAQQGVQIATLQAQLQQLLQRQQQ